MLPPFLIETLLFQINSASPPMIITELYLNGSDRGGRKSIYDPLLSKWSGNRFEIPVGQN